MGPTQFQQNPTATKQSRQDSDKTGKFHPKSQSDNFIQRQKDKFYSLQQGGRTVAGYGAEFMKLLKYVDGVSDEKVKVNIFISGLNRRIGSCVDILEPCTLRVAMRKAVLIEEETIERKGRLEDPYVFDQTDRFCCEYLPDHFFQRQVNKLFSLQQGHRAVTEYCDRFMALSIYVRCLTVDQILLNRFIMGLKQQLRPIVRILEPSTFEEAGCIALHVERLQENPHVNFEGLLQETSKLRSRWREDPSVNFESLLEETLKLHC